ncbi:MAG: MgtC/SapB family protein [Clostridia bacterium]|nr:MgtC/SapB family protein [Clostridia bacterium]
MLAYLKEFNFASVCVRLALAMIAGAVLGFGRGRKKQTAGLRTYLITCVGASLASLIGFFEYQMLCGEWSFLPALADTKFDGARFSSAVISGIGFLAAGSIMLIAHQQVSGLTTAIGLFITACIGIACGAGFYEVVIVAVVFIVVVMELMQSVEVTFKRKIRNMTIHVAFDDIEHSDMITDTIKNEGATIYEFELENPGKSKTPPSAILWIKLPRDNPSHSSILSSIAELPCVSSVQELIS